MRDIRPVENRGDAGFALILAILSLLLLTFLGLTLAASTTTELQIATNYRWSEQAYYNAEAGIEVAKAYIKILGGASAVLPNARSGAWQPIPGTQVPVTAKMNRNDAWSYPSRNFEPNPTGSPATNSTCDGFAAGAGYGVVFDDGSTPGMPLQNVTQIRIGTAPAVSLNGAFTVWIRRATEFTTDGTRMVQDRADDDEFILTAEGVAPFHGQSAGEAGAAGAFQRANRAVRFVENRVTVVKPCLPRGPQGSPTGKDECDLPL